MTKDEALSEADGLITCEWDEDGLRENGTILEAWTRGGEWHFLVARSDHKGRRLEEYAFTDGWYAYLGTVDYAEGQVVAGFLTHTERRWCLCVHGQYEN